MKTLCFHYTSDNMYVRVHNIKNKQFYKSMVYGLINIGYYEQAIVFNPHSQCFELIDYINKDSKAVSPQYEVICDNQNDWVTYDNIHLRNFKKYLEDNKSTAHIDLFQGYQEIFEDFQFLAQIMEKRCVLLVNTSVIPRTNEDIDYWNYIRTQQDADDFMKIFAGFHDATLDSLSYDEKYNRPHLNVTFDNSGWYGVVECCFEGLIALNLRPYCENYSREIFGATLLVKDESIFWADDNLKSESLSYEGSYIKALNLKWRKVVNQ